MVGLAEKREGARVPYPDAHLTFGARVGNAGRIVIPDWVRRELGIKEGDFVLVTVGVQKYWSKAKEGREVLEEVGVDRGSRVVYR